MTRRSLGAALLGLSGCALRRLSPLAKAAAWLWGQQDRDGGWHSQTYGLLRSGQSLTPFVLGALLEVPEDVYPRAPAAIDRALEFSGRHTQATGALGMADRDVPEYPNYSTALAVGVLGRIRRPGWDSQAAPMVAWLRGQQFTEGNGWRPSDPAYGAWGMGGDRRTPPGTGHVDLSMTRYVLDAFRAAGVAETDSAFARARVFVERCQNFDPQHSKEADGGFFFSTTEFDTNKAGEERAGYFRSYGSTTADGILALLATGHTPSSDRIAAAGRWLSARHRGMDVPGFVGDAYRRWPRGLAFYYAAASATAFHALEIDPGSCVADSLRSAQRADGSWSNPENLVKEDDPLIATAFAIRALAIAGGV
jgi:hypothetical protein